MLIDKTLGVGGSTGNIVEIHCGVLHCGCFYVMQNHLVIKLRRAPIITKNDYIPMWGFPFPLPFLFFCIFKTTQTDGQTMTFFRLSFLRSIENLCHFQTLFVKKKKNDHQAKLWQHNQQQQQQQQNTVNKERTTQAQRTLSGRICRIIRLRIHHKQTTSIS